MARRVMYYFLVLVVVSFSFAGCKIKKENEASKEEKNLNIYVDIKDKYSQNIMKFIIDEFKKEKENVNVNLINPLNADNIEEKISKEKIADIIFTSRNNMINLTKKGLLNDLTVIYKKNKFDEKLYNILTTYGRVGDKYYGVGLIPYSIEIFYNNDNLKKIGVTEPKDINELINILKKLSENKTKIPVFMTEDLDIYNGTASIIVSNTSDVNKLEEKYDSGMEGYKDLKEIQQLFNDVYYLSKSGFINKDIFEVVNEKNIDKLISDETPILIANSYIAKDLKSDKIGIVENYNIVKNKENVPVIVNAVMCIPANVENEEMASEFIQFIFEEKTQKLLKDEGFITGTKEDSEKLEGLNKIINDHLSNANSNSIIYIYNFPTEFQGRIQSKLEKILEGKYTGNEWEEILGEVYGKNKNKE